MESLLAAYGSDSDDGEKEEEKKTKLDGDERAPPLPDDTTRMKRDERSTASTSYGADNDSREWTTHSQRDNSKNAGNDHDVDGKLDGNHDGNTNDDQEEEEEELRTLKKKKEKKRSKRARVDFEAFAAQQGVDVVEVNATELLHAHGGRHSFDMTTPSSVTQPDKVVGMAKRKHQISSLYSQYAANELQMRESKSLGVQKKQQTRAKYGW